MTHTPHPAPGADADELRATYRDLMCFVDAGIADQKNLIDLVIVAIELGKMGYTLNTDKTDWQPPLTAKE